jgi:hypothetical protein
MMDETPKQSDQLPEEGPAGQVPDDVPAAGEGAAREASRENAKGAAGDQADRASERGYRDDEEQEAYEREAPDAADEEVGGG